MKKLTVLIIIVMLTVMGSSLINARDGGPCEVKTYSLSVGAGVRNFSEPLFDEVYGSAPVTYYLDFGAMIWNTLEVFIHADYLKKDGKTTFTREDTTLTIIPLELGARYLFNTAKEGRCKMRFFPYIGAGAGYYSIKEDTPSGTIKENRMGFFFEGGFRLYPTGSFFIDAKLKNVILKSENGTKLGGMAYMGGIGISF